MARRRSKKRGRNAAQNQQQPKLVFYGPPNRPRAQRPRRRGNALAMVAVPRPKTRMEPRERLGTETSNYARSLLNPFEFSSCIPDGAKGVGCFSIKQEHDLTTGALGSSSIAAFAPSVNAFSYVETAVQAVLSTPVVAGNWSPCLSTITIQGLYGKVRPISGGLRAMYVGNTSTDSGYLLLGRVGAFQALSAFNNVSLQTAAALCMDYKVFPLRTGGQACWMPGDEDDTSNFLTDNSVISTGTALVKPYLICIFYGAAASQGCLHIEAVYNFEGQYQNQTFLPGGLDRGSTHGEVGWYQKAISLFDSAETILPMVSGVIERGASLVSGVRAMARAVNYGRLGGSGLPLLLRN